MGLIDVGDTTVVLHDLNRRSLRERVRKSVVKRQHYVLHLVVGFQIDHVFSRHRSLRAANQGRAVQPRR